MAFVRSVEAGLRAALVARHGPQRGREAANDALVVGWQQWDRIRQMDNPAGYLYRVGHRKALRKRLVPTPVADGPVDREPWVEPGLPAALRNLSNRQRQVVVLIEGYGHTFREVAQLLGTAPSSVQTHHKRALRRLRAALGVPHD